MRHFRSSVVVSALFVTLTGVLPLPAHQDAPPPKNTAPALGNRLTVEVTGGDANKPIENASVYLRAVEKHRLKDKKIELSVKTNQEGIAHVPDIPLGRVLIQVVADGWKSYGQNFDITDPKQTISIHLDRPPKWY
jgi:hypothetical protein